VNQVNVDPVAAGSGTRSVPRLLSKVPEVTIWFWVIKVLCTTVGETAADYLNVNRNLGLTGTSVVTGLLLVVALVLQFSSKRYVPWRYWLTVSLVSIFGTLVTDNLSDKLKVRLEVSTIVLPSCSRLPSSPGTRWTTHCRSTPSSPGDVRRSTGWRCS
jgi:uncharacterized membrane-anchored protein